MAVQPQEQPAAADESEQVPQGQPLEPVAATASSESLPQQQQQQQHQEQSAAAGVPGPQQGQPQIPLQQDSQSQHSAGGSESEAPPQMQRQQDVQRSSQGERSAEGSKSEQPAPAQQQKQSPRQQLSQRDSWQQGTPPQHEQLAFSDWPERHEFWELSEVAQQPAASLCFPCHPAASRLAHVLTPCGWAFVAALEGVDSMAAQDVENLIAALTPGAEPLRIVWCVPRRLWLGWRAPSIEGPVCHGPRSSRGVTAGSLQAVQQYALQVTLRQRVAGAKTYEWV